MTGSILQSIKLNYGALRGQLLTLAGQLLTQLLGKITEKSLRTTRPVNSSVTESVILLCRRSALNTTAAEGRRDVPPNQKMSSQVPAVLHVSLPPVARNGLPAKHEGCVQLAKCILGGKKCTAAVHCGQTSTTQVVKFTPAVQLFEQQ